MTEYCFDANIVINLHRDFPRDIWPSVGEREVLIELQRIDDDCVSWSKLFEGFIAEPAEEHIALVAEIANAHPDWVVEQKNQADPWIIAQAEIRTQVVVTQERRRGPGAQDRNLGIPNVADERGVPWVDFNQMARDEGWTF